MGINWDINIEGLTPLMIYNLREDTLTAALMEQAQARSNGLTSFTPTDNAIKVVVEKYGWGGRLDKDENGNIFGYSTGSTSGSSSSSSGSYSSGLSSSSSSSDSVSGIPGVKGTVDRNGIIILDNSSVTPVNLPEKYQQLGYIPGEIIHALGTKIYTTGTFAGSQNVTIQSGNTLMLNLTKETSNILSLGGSFNGSGVSNANIVGDYNNLNLTGLNLGTKVSASVSGSTVLDGVFGKVGITLNGANASLISEKTNASVTANNADSIDFDTGSLVASGNVHDFRIANGTSSNVNLGLTGTGLIINTTGTVGLTLNGTRANATIDGAGYDYLTAGDGSITLNNKASANITGADTKGGGLFINANGGQINYQADHNTNATINVGNGNAYLTYNKGYTATQVNMSGNTFADINGFKPSNGMVLATNLNSLSDVSVSYHDNNAYVSEAGKAGSIILHDVKSGGVNLLTSLNGQDFTHSYGSNTLMIALNSHA